MKKLFAILLFLNFSALYCQTLCDDYCINFEDTLCTYQLFYDTTISSDNVWQIGQPNKSQFNNAASQPNVIITDSQ